MTEAFRVLGLAPDADERAIKRAYAALLRVHRPDDDPVGFQRINEAYAHALELCRGRAAGAWGAPEAPTPDVTAPDGAQEGQREPLRAHALERTAPIGATDAAPAPPRDERWDLPAELLGETHAEQRAALDTVLDVARTGRVRALEEHLRGAFTYWTIDAKRQLAWQLFDRLVQEPVAMPRDCFDALMAFFGLDDVHAARDVRHLDLLRHECEQWWRLRHRDMPKAVASREDKAEKAYREMINLLREPFSWWNTPWYALRPGIAEDMVRFLHSLGFVNTSRLPRGIDPATLHFWAGLLVLDPPINRPRAAVFALRTLLGSLLLSLLFAAFAQDGGRSAMELALAGFTTGVGVASVWLALQVYNRWQGLRGPFEWPAWLVPGLAVATLVSMPLSEDGSSTEVFSALTLLLPLWRDVHAWIRRRGSGAHDVLNFGTGYLLMGCTFVALAIMFWLPNWAPAAIAMPLWAWQLWRIRRARA